MRRRSTLKPDSHKVTQSKLDFDKLASGLGAERRGRVKISAGYFGAAQLAVELAHRLRVPANGGRPTDPTWTERRTVPLRPATLERLNADAERLNIEPMQLAALLIEKGLDGVEQSLSRRTPVPRRRGAGKGPRPAPLAPGRG